MNRKVDLDQRRAVIERLAKAGLRFLLATMTIFARAYRCRVGTIYADLRSLGLAISARRRAEIVALGPLPQPAPSSTGTTMTTPTDHFQEGMGRSSADFNW
jgi:hypothetical protein